MKLPTPSSLLLVLLGTSSIAHAEGGTCPNGYYPANTPGVMGCAPIPGYYQQQVTPQPPPSLWADRWGAIVVGKPGTLGVSKDMSDQKLAVQSAITDCRAKGGTECELQISYANGCGVVVVGNPGFNAGNADTLEEATEHGLKVCQDAGAINCHVYYSACSPAVQIR